MTRAGDVQRHIDELMADGREWTAQELAEAHYGPDPTEYQIGSIRRALRTLHQRGNIQPGKLRTATTYVRKPKP